MNIPYFTLVSYARGEPKGSVYNEGSATTLFCVRDFEISLISTWFLDFKISVLISPDTNVSDFGLFHGLLCYYFWFRVSDFCLWFSSTIFWACWRQIQGVWSCKATHNFFIGLEVWSYPAELEHWFLYAISGDFSLDFYILLLISLDLCWFLVISHTTFHSLRTPRSTTSYKRPRYGSFCIPAKFWIWKVRVVLLHSLSFATPSRSTRLGIQNKYDNSLYNSPLTVDPCWMTVNLWCVQFEC